MKNATLKVGIDKPTAVSVTVPYLEAVTQADIEARYRVKFAGEVSAESLAVLTRQLDRTHRIESQERSGARDVVKDNSGKTEAEIAALVAPVVANYDPFANAARGRSAGPKEAIVDAPKGMTKAMLEEIAKQALAGGVKLVFRTTSTKQG
jgi:hypothetical protein